MAAYFVFDNYKKEMIEIGEYCSFNGTAYMIPEYTQLIEIQEYKATITSVETGVDTHLTYTISNQPIVILKVEYDLESNNSEDVFQTEDGMIASSALDYRMNFDELTTAEALELMEYIANGDMEDAEEDELEDYNFNAQLDKAYDEMDLTDLNEDFLNMTFVPRNAHVSAWRYCNVCENYGHNESDH